MKKIISLLISIILLLSSVPVLADNTQTNPKKAGEAIALIEAITETDLFDGDCEMGVTRAEFVTLMAETMKATVSPVKEKVFFDVADNAQYAPYVYWVLQNGYISSAELFRPDDVITLDEAIKICVSAMGQTKFAEMNGGYPEGYKRIAIEAELLDNMQNAGTMTKNNVAIMFYNMLLSELLSIESISGNDVNYSYIGKTLLYEIHKTKIAEGLITQTRLTSFDKDYSYNPNNNTVAVNGVEYYCDINIDAYFGMNCLVFCEEADGGENIIGVYPKDNECIEFNLEDVESFDGKYLEINTDNGKQKKYEVKVAYTEVYNGKVTIPERTHITDLNGTAKLLDNNDDGEYDIVFINHYTYAQVRNVSIADRLIEDENSVENNINIDDKNVFFTIADSNGNKLKLSDIEAGNVLSVLKSQDNTIAHITVLINPVLSKIESVDDEGKVIIGGIEYIISDYAARFCDDRFKAGTEVEVYINSNGEIAYAYFVGEQYTYGYLTNIYKDEVDEYFIRVFASIGEFRNYRMAEKLMLDGVKDTNKKIYSSLNSGFTDQLIRYKLNKNGFVISIDTAEECIIDDSVTLEQWEAEKDENNLLTRYEFGKSSYMFRQNYCFGTSFNAVGSTVFMLPVKSGTSDVIDIANKDDFEMLDVTKIQTGFAYSYFDVYDVNEFGTASVLVARNVKTAGSPYSFRATSNLKSSAGMIANVKTSVNDDGDFGFSIEMWSNGAFKEYFLSEDIECIMAPGARLQKGDVVRFRADGDEIVEIILDFDYDTFEGNYSYNNTSAQFNKGNTTLTYQVGKLYNYDDKFCSYSNVKKGEQYDFAPVNLNNSQVNINKICCYDAESGIISTITVNELRAGKIYGDSADYILIRQDGLITQCIFVYRNGGN